MFKDEWEEYFVSRYQDKVAKYGEQHARRWVYGYTAKTLFFAAWEWANLRGSSTRESQGGEWLGRHQRFGIRAQVFSRPATPNTSLACYFSGHDIRKLSTAELLEISFSGFLDSGQRKRLRTAAAARFSVH
jgi:hypothetical protein